MNALYYVALYNHTQNCWMHVLVTCPASMNSEEAASKARKDYAEDGHWKVRKCVYVLDTNEEIGMEV